MSLPAFNQARKQPLIKPIKCAVFAIFTGKTSANPNNNQNSSPKPFSASLSPNSLPEFTRTVQTITDTTGKEISGLEIWNEFQNHYLSITKPFELVSFNTSQNAAGHDRTTLSVVMRSDGSEIKLDGGISAM